MTTVATRPAAPVPTRVGQTTAIEQSRAAAEVHAAVVVAQQVPRLVDRAIGEMRQSCARMRLAERAFYRYPRGGQTVSGPSVHLARELARCWGNIQYNTGELSRDDEHGQSEMQAWAWDVQTNTRSSLTFIVPHKRDKKGGAPEPLVDLRDVYENNANMGARRLREAIFSVLPPWFVQEAIDACMATLEKGEGDKPLPQRIADAVKVAEAWGVTVAQLEARVGRRREQWLPTDLATLLVIFQSVRRGEIRVEDEFEAERLTAAEILGAAKPAAQAPPAGVEPPAEPVAEPAEPQLITGPQQKKLHALLNSTGREHRDVALVWIAGIVGHEIATTKALTRIEAGEVIGALEDEIAALDNSPGDALWPEAAQPPADSPAVEDPS